MKWTRQPQEQENHDFWFAGRCYVTAGVSASLTPLEVAWIVMDIQNFVLMKQGIDYLQVYEREDGLKVWVIDQVPRCELEDHPKDHNHYTILFPDEY